MLSVSVAETVDAGLYVFFACGDPDPILEAIVGDGWAGVGVDQQEPRLTRVREHPATFSVGRPPQHGDFHRGRT